MSEIHSEIATLDLYIYIKSIRATPHAVPMKLSI